MQPLASHIRLQQRQALVTYEFHWKAAVFGKIELEADSGTEADKAFHAMNFGELSLSETPPEIDKTTLEIRFVDLPAFDSIDREEWERYWKNIL